MKSVTFLLTTILLAGCAPTMGTKNDLTRYGTAPSEEDLHQMMSQYRDTLPPTRYVSYHDQGYLDSVKKVSYTDDQGKVQYAWAYDFEVATYDDVNKAPSEWSPRRAIFFNGRPIRISDQTGTAPPRGNQTTPPAQTTPTPTPSTVNPRP